MYNVFASGSFTFFLEMGFVGRVICGVLGQEHRVAEGEGERGSLVQKFNLVRVCL